MYNKSLTLRIIGAASLAIVSATTVAGVAAAEKRETVLVPEPSKPGVAEADRRYCTGEQRTGSRVNHRECRTAAQWRALGIDISSAEPTTGTQVAATQN